MLHVSPEPPTMVQNIKVPDKDRSYLAFHFFYQSGRVNLGSRVTAGGLTRVWARPWGLHWFMVRKCASAQGYGCSDDHDSNSWFSTDSNFAWWWMESKGLLLMEVVLEDIQESQTDIAKWRFIICIRAASYLRYVCTRPWSLRI